MRRGTIAEPELEPRAIRKNISTYTTRFEAYHAASILRRMTGDDCKVVSIDRVYFQIVRTDPSGREAEQ